MVAWKKLWGKTKKGETTITHALICHMIDVAEVIGTLWERSLYPNLRRRIARTLDCSEEEAQRIISFWAALHDLGKASPAFQRQYPPIVPYLEAEGLSFKQEFGGDLNVWHGVISAWALSRILERWGTPRNLAYDLARGLGGHHGSWPPPNYSNTLNRDAYGDALWENARSGLVEALANLYEPIPLKEDLLDRAERQAFIVLISGLVSVADWIGSMEEYFGFCPEPDDLVAYKQKAAEAALQAVISIRWADWRPPQEPAKFSTLFPQCRSPRPMQQVIIDLAPRLQEPSLVLIEAPTGSGKTEAALYLADYWAWALQQRGLYMAMPTVATSNQMYTRLGEMLNARYGQGSIKPLLVHGQARWVEPPPEIATEGEVASEQEIDRLAAMSWFLPRKRSLLAPFGVGTVDQALLGVLLTRHFFVRLFGLASKTVIFDEVHAYDTYMSTLFARLLSWLKAQGTSVILLSATLPASTRRDFLKAYGAPDDLDAHAVQYPAVTWVCGGRGGWQPLPSSEDRSLALEWLPHSDEALINTLRAALTDGGCAAVLCNTVARAQQVYLTLRDAALVDPDDLILFHGRFPQVWREDIEKEVLTRYGKDSTPDQRRGIVVATQVIEQSLDLDFDLLITDLAPIDLLIQRAGRLHRHEGRKRPAPLVTPRLGIMMPVNAESLPEWGGDAYVYEPYILLRTWLALQGRTALTLPSETQALIEAVYGEEEVDVDPKGAFAKALIEAKAKWEQHCHEHIQQAKQKLVLPPLDEDLFRQPNLVYEEESSDIHQAMRALTRLSEPSVALVCLHRHLEGITLDPNSDAFVDLEMYPSDAMTREFARRTVQVTHGGLVACLLEQPVPQAWQRHPLLRYDRLAVFENGVCHIEGTQGAYTLRLLHELGLVVERER